MFMGVTGITLTSANNMVMMTKCTWYVQFQKYTLTPIQCQVPCLTLVISIFFLEKFFERKTHIFISFFLPSIPSSTLSYQASALLLHMNHSGEDPRCFLIARFNSLLSIPAVVYVCAVSVMLTAVPAFTPMSPSFLLLFPSFLYYSS